MRETPSGSGTFTDFTNVIFSIVGDDSSALAAGEYIAGFEANIFGALIPITDPLAIAVLAFESLGLKTRRGRIGRVRVLMGADDTGIPLGTRAPTILQFVTLNTKTGVVLPVGATAEVPWGGFVDTSSLFSVDITQLLNLPLNFPSAKWERGDCVGLKVTLGAITQGDPIGAMQLSIETLYEPLAPVIGPSER